MLEEVIGTLSMCFYDFFNIKQSNIKFHKSVYRMLTKEATLSTLKM